MRTIGSRARLSRCTTTSGSKHDARDPSRPSISVVSNFKVVFVGIMPSSAGSSALARRHITIRLSTEVRQDERRYQCFSFTLLTNTILIPTLIKPSTLSRCAGGWAGRTSRGPSGGWRGAEPISACRAAGRASQRPDEQQRCRLGAQLQVLDVARL
jgi:hypothetical protein